MPAPDHLVGEGPVCRARLYPERRNRYVDDLRKMAGYLADNFCSEVVMKKLAELFGFGSDHTAENNYSYLKQAFLFQGLNKYSFKSAERIRGEKAYLVDVYFHKDGYEVDFVVVEKTKILEMIQVTFKMDSTKTRTRELGGLAKAYAKFRCKNLTLISLNERGTEIYKKIPIKKVTIVDWLLGNVI